MMQIIAFTGQAKNGKSEYCARIHKHIANLLTAKYADSDIEFEQDTTVIKKSFAYALKELLRKVYGGSYDNWYGSKKEEPLEDGISARQRLKIFGTDVVRTYDDDFWIKILRRELIQSSNHASALDTRAIILIDDVRFDNEARMLKEFPNTKIYKVINTNLPPVKVDHASENGIGDELVDAVLEASSLEDIQSQVEGFITEDTRLCSLMNL